MILSFSEDRFKERILDGTKGHTIRTDRTERWRKGMLIHFWRGNPRNTRATPKPHEFHRGNCSGVQKIEMHFEKEGVRVKIDNRLLEEPEVLTLAICDGFDSITDMCDWFIDFKETGFKGRLIHWTKKKY